MKVITVLTIMAAFALSSFATIQEKYIEATRALDTASKTEQMSSKNTASLSTTPVTTGTENGHEWVDLGLSVKWATCNIGASNSGKYGDYFAWGEINPKSDYGWYDWDTYNYCKESNETLTKYCSDSEYGIVDNKTSLDLSDDVARANWGGSWRMPTMNEFEALIEECTWTWTTQNGYNGYKVISRINGNSIFLPAAGFRSYTSLLDDGSHGYYWSSLLDKNNPDIARGLGFNSDGVGKGISYRCSGLPIRPVCP